MDKHKWIRLNAGSAKLKVGSIEDETYLFILGLPRTSPQWQQTVDVLGFGAASRYLVRKVARHERITIADYRRVFPAASLAEMAPADFRLDFNRESSSEARERERREALIEVQSYTLLGRNRSGDRVYDAIGGRVILREADWARVREAQGLSGVAGADFLRAATPADLDAVADGVIASILRGEPQRSADFDRLAHAVGLHAPAQRSDFRARVDAAMLRHLRQAHSTPEGAYLDSRDLYEGMVPWAAGALGEGAVPLPMAILVQRYLGDMAGKRLLVTSGFDAATFFYLAGGDVVAYAGAKDMRDLAGAIVPDTVQWREGAFRAIRDAEVFDAVIHNADKTQDGGLDVASAAGALEGLPGGGRAVFLLPDSIGSRAEVEFYKQLGRRFRIIDAYRLDPRLTKGVGSEGGLRLIYLSNDAPTPHTVPRNWAELPLVHGWDEIKGRVEEAVHRAGVVGMQDDGVSLERVRQENRLQRPYMAFSKIGEAISMAPSDLQEGMQAALSRVESIHGPVDDFVMHELGYGEQTLRDNFAPEQVDAMAISFDRMMRGSSTIIADDTGMGKGRTVAAHAAWADRHGMSVVFMTDRASLFSDFYRDLDDIGERGRFRTLIVNRDAVIEDLVGDGGIWGQSDPPQFLEDCISEGRPLASIGRNLVLCTYSQISTEDSAKAQWLKEQMGGALLICDESHLAAGDDSNRSSHVLEMINMAKAVVYSSATWAKTEKNLALYGRAFPPSINRATLAKSMIKGGEAFATMFSAMLAQDGALVRREHDISRVEFRFSDPSAYRQRNIEVADSVSEIMGQIAYLARDISRLTRRAEEGTIRALREAREARETAQGSVLRSTFGSGSMLYQVMRRLMTSLAVDQACDEAIQSAAEGRKPVLVFDDTAESILMRLMPQATQDADGQTIVPTPTIKNLLEQAADRLLVVRKRIVTVEDVEEFVADAEEERAAEEAQENAEMAGQPAAPAQEPVAGAPAAPAAAAADDAGVQVDAALAAPAAGTARRRRRAREEVVNLLDEMDGADRDALVQGMGIIRGTIERLPDVPINVPDMIAARLRAAGMRVGEISGRKYGIESTGERDAAGRMLGRLVPRKGRKRLTNQTVRAFNRGDVDAVVINRSGATGLSMHSSERFEDQRQRHLFELQAPANPTERLQLLGRVQRRGEVVPPVVSFCASGIYGEMRQMLLNNRALRNLSANVRSSGDSFVVNKNVPDLLNPLGAEIIRTYLLDNPGIASRLMIHERFLKEEGATFGLADQFTSRLALLTNREQQMVYDDVEALYNDALQANPERASAIEVMPERVTEVDLTRRTLFGPPEDVNQDWLSAFDGRVEAMRIEWVEKVTPPSWEKIVQMATAARQRLLDEGMASAGDADLAAPARRLDDQVAPMRLEVDRVVFMQGGDESDADAAEVEDPIAESVVRAQGGASFSIAQFGFDPCQPWMLGETLPSLTVSPDAVVGGMLRVPPRVAGSAGTGMPRLLRGFRPLDIGADLAEQRLLDSMIAPVRNVRMEPLAQRMTSQFDALARIALSSMDRVDTIAEALAREGDNPVKRAVQRKTWAERFVSRLSPGRVIDFYVDRDRGTMRTGLVLDVQTPDPRRAVQLASWGVKLLMLDNGREETMTMSRLAAARAQVIVDALDKSARNTFVMADIRRLRPVERSRSAAVLAGNLYAAEEWALATKIGRPVIYTDIWGDRHRAVILREKFTRDDLLNRLPARAWDEAVIANVFLSTLADADAPVLRAHTSHFGAVRDDDLVILARVRVDPEKMQAAGAPTIDGNGCTLTLSVGEGARMSKTKMRKLIETQRKLLATRSPEIAARLRVYSLKKIEAVQILLRDIDEEGVRALVHTVSAGMGLELYARQHTAVHERIEQAQRHLIDTQLRNRSTYVIEPLRELAEPAPQREPRMAA